MRMLALAGLVWVSGYAFGVTNWSPTVRLNGRVLAGMPSDIHRPLGQGIEILQKEDCGARELGGARVDVPERCGYLRGIYRYIFVPEGETKKAQMIVEFSFSRKSAASYTLLVDGPVELGER